MVFSKTQWKKLHEACGKNPYQSMEWAQTNETPGFKPNYITIKDNNGDYTAGLLYFEESTSILGIKRNKLIAEGVPLSTNKKSEKELLKEFKKRVSSGVYGSIKPLSFERSNVFTEAGMVEDMYHTIILDLTKPLEVLWKEAEKKSARWGVKKSRKEGVTVKELSSKDELAAFYKTYEETAVAGKFNALPFEFFERFYELMHGTQGYILIAKKDGKVIGGSLLVNSDSYMRLRIQASLRDYMHCQPSSALYWAAVEFAKEKGFKYLDLGGYGKYAAKGSKSEKVSQYKARFGGDIVECPTYYYGKLYVGLKKLLSYFGRK